jgi:hypothetical protein
LPDEKCLGLLEMRDFEHDFVQLELKLLAIAGHVVVRILDRRIFFVLRDGFLMQGRIFVYEPTHTNSFWNAIFRSRKLHGETEICIGYALSSNGLWRLHSWARRMNSDGSMEILDSTPHIAYFGYVLGAGDEAEFFHSAALRFVATEEEADQFVIDALGPERFQGLMKMYKPGFATNPAG